MHEEGALAGGGHVRPGERGVVESAEGEVEPVGGPSAVSSSRLVIWAARSRSIGATASWPARRSRSRASSLEPLDRVAQGRDDARFVAVGKLAGDLPPRARGAPPASPRGCGGRTRGRPSRPAAGRSGSARHRPPARSIREARPRSPAPPPTPPPVAGSSPAVRRSIAEASSSTRAETGRTRYRLSSGSSSTSPPARAAPPMPAPPPPRGPRGGRRPPRARARPCASFSPTRWRSSSGSGWSSRLTPSAAAIMISWSSSALSSTGRRIGRRQRSRCRLGKPC